MEQAQVLNVQLSTQFPPKPTVQSQNYHPRHRPPTSIPGTSDCILGVQATSQLCGSQRHAAPRGGPHSQEVAVASFGQPPPPGPSERGIQLLGVSLHSQSGGNSSEGCQSPQLQSFSLDPVLAGRALPRLRLAASTAPVCPALASHNPCVGLLLPGPVPERPSCKEMATPPMALLGTRALFCCLR